jgi:predicted ATP-dependent endonuclease of OLD family
MLKGLKITNFKPFGDCQPIRLAPITLVYGPNSSGKSSIIQSLLLMRQTLSNRHHAGKRQLVTNGEFVDLGGFLSLVHKHESRLKLILDYDFSENISAIRSEFVKGISLQFGAHSNNSASLEANLEKIRFGAIDQQRNPISFSLTRTNNPSDESNEVYEDEVIDEDELPLKDQFKFDHILKKDLSRFIQLAYYAESRNVRPGNSIRTIEAIEQNIGVYKNLIDWVRFTSPSLNETDLLSFRQSYQSSEFPGLNDETNNSIRQDELPSFRQLLIAYQRQLQKTIGGLTYLGPLRASPERIYSLQTSEINSVGTHGQRAIQLLYQNSRTSRGSDSYLERLNSIAQQFEIPYTFKLTPIAEKIVGEYVVLELHDNRTGVSVSPTDVGFGIGQLLPILIEGLVASERNSNLVCVEQPEIHLHPRLQASLGDFFIDSAIPLRQRNSQNNRSRERPVQWILETHSEALIMRIQRRIREKRLLPSDVSVLYVEPSGEQGSQIKELRLDESGEFIDLWPDGFFVEGLQDLLGGY